MDWSDREPAMREGNFGVAESAESGQRLHAANTKAKV